MQHQENSESTDSVARLLLSSKASWAYPLCDGKREWPQVPGTVPVFLTQSWFRSVVLESHPVFVCFSPALPSLAGGLWSHSKGHQSFSRRNYGRN